MEIKETHKIMRFLSFEPFYGFSLRVYRVFSRDTVENFFLEKFTKGKLIVFLVSVLRTPKNTKLALCASRLFLYLL